MTHICISKLTIIGSDNGLLPSRRQAIIWTNAGILLIRPSGTNSSEILIEIDGILIQVNAFESVVFETAAILSRPQCVNPLIAGPTHLWIQIRIHLFAIFLQYSHGSIHIHIHVYLIIAEMDILIKAWWLCHITLLHNCWNGYTY